MKKPLTQKDIDIEIAEFEAALKSPTAAKTAKPPTDDGKYLTMQFEPYPESGIDQIREGKPIRIKTVFHAVELSIEDQSGGKLTCEYSVRPAVFQLAEQVAKSYPKYSVEEIERLSSELGISYSETKKVLARRIAEQTIFIRAKIGRFLHRELRPALEVMLQDLHMDAFAIGLSGFGYTLADSKDVEKTFKTYTSLRRRRIADVKHIGRPKGSIKFDPEEVNQVVLRVAEILTKLSEKKLRVTKNAIARGLYPQNSNPVQQLNRLLTRYGIDFLDVLNESKKVRAKEENI